MSLLRLRFLSSNPSFLISIPSGLFSQYSHSFAFTYNHNYNANDDDIISSFNCMLQLCPTPPIVEFNKILGSLVKMKHYSTVISLSRRMDVTGIQPNIVTFNILINCFGHLRQMTFVFSVFAKILKLGYQPNAITLTTLIKGLFLKGEVKKAMHFHDDAVVAKGFQLDQVSYGTLINGLVVKWDIQELPCSC